MKQRTLAVMAGFEQHTKKTRRAQFLEEMEQVVPWRELGALVNLYLVRKNTPAHGGRLARPRTSLPCARRQRAQDRSIPMDHWNRTA